LRLFAYRIPSSGTWGPTGYVEAPSLEDAICWVDDETATVYEIYI